MIFEGQVKGCIPNFGWLMTDTNQGVRRRRCITSHCGAKFEIHRVNVMDTCLIADTKLALAIFFLLSQAALKNNAFFKN
ncbi:MAG: hypothetical protein QM768_22630 [Agriterribacter sp.]